MSGLFFWLIRFCVKHSPSIQEKDAIADRKAFSSVEHGLVLTYDSCRLISDPFRTGSGTC
jgi:hypothetical protein